MEMFITMKALVLSFRRGRRTLRRNQIILEIPGVKDRKRALSFVGRRVLWETDTGKRLKGTITGAHGNKGRVRARFSKGLPGQIIGERVEIL